MSSLSSVQQICSQVDQLTERRRYAQALELITQGFQSSPANPELLYREAVVEFSMQNFDQSRESLRLGLTESPRHFGMRVLLADVDVVQGRLAEAERTLLGLLAERPTSSALHASYADLMFRALQIEKGTALAAEALRLDPHNPHALYVAAIGGCIAAGSRGEGPALALLVEARPDATKTVLALITHLMHAGRFSAAHRLAIEILESRPDSEEIQSLVAETECLSHWTMVPLRPVLRWGHAAQVPIVLLATVVLATVLLAMGRRSLGNEGQLILAAAACAFLLYLAFYPRLLRFLVRRRLGLKGSST